MFSKERFETLLVDYVQQGYMVHSYTSQPHDSGGLHFSSEVKEVKVLMKNKRDETLCVQLISKSLPIKEKQVTLNSQVSIKEPS